jgi:hypothetical protein
MSDTARPSDLPNAAPPDPSKEIARLQTRLASRMLLVFAVPFMVIVVLAMYAYTLSSRLNELEALERIGFIERWYQDSRNLSWAIDQYETLIETQRRPQVLVRLATLYFEDSRPVKGGAGRFDTATVARAKRLLEDANELYSRRTGREYWETYMTLTYMHIELAEHEDDPKRKAEHHKAAIRAGKKAIELQPLDAQTLNNLAWIHATSDSPDIRDLDRAARFATTAVEQTRRRNRDYLDTLEQVQYQLGADRNAGRISESERATTSSPRG